jgi:DNA-binding transcriptional MerR regulator
VVFTAQEIVDNLKQEGDIEATLRMVRYYTQIGLVPDLELHGNKRVYTERHLDYFRAIRTMSRTGQKLDDIKRDLQKMDSARIKKIGHQMSNYTSEKLIEKSDMEQIEFNPNIILQISSTFDQDKKGKIVKAIQTILKS